MSTLSSSSNTLVGQLQEALFFKMKLEPIKILELIASTRPTYRLYLFSAFAEMLRLVMLEFRSL